MKVVLETHYKIVVLLKFDLKLMLLINMGGGKMGGLSLERARYELGKHGCTELKAKPGKKWDQAGIRYLLVISDPRD